MLSTTKAVLLSLACAGVVFAQTTSNEPSTSGDPQTFSLIPRGVEHVDANSKRLLQSQPE